jgi:predicted nucleotidyltransferase
LGKSAGRYVAAGVAADETESAVLFRGPAEISQTECQSGKIEVGQSTAMNKDDVIARLRSHEAELKRAGVLRLSVFGSVARGEAKPDSDVDLNAQLDRTKRISLFEAVAIENRLSEILGVKADLSIQGTLKPDIQEQFDREAVVAF